MINEGSVEILNPWYCSHYFSFSAVVCVPITFFLELENTYKLCAPVHAHLSNRRKIIPVWPKAKKNSPENSQNIDLTCCGVHLY